jgi:hypothetical protein
MPESKRVNLQFLKRFSAESRNGQLFSWAKKQYPNWADILIANGFDFFWVMRVAAKGASPGEIAAAKKSALASMSMRMDSFIGDLPDPSFGVEAKQPAINPMPMTAVDELFEDENEELPFEDEETL